MGDDLRELYTDLIREHDKKPRHFYPMPEATCKARGKNPICGDNYEVFVKVEGDLIRDISFQGSGCCISKASASMMAGLVAGKSGEYARNLFKGFHDMVTTGAVDVESMGKLAAFDGVYKFPVRVKCAILPWHAMLAALNGEQSATTEEKP